MTDFIDLIDKELDKQLQIAYPQIIFEAMRYSVFPSGKRVRPVILLAVCEALGGRAEHALPFAAALEMIHTYSMIHDDLPAMDDDDMRRGRPTSHIKYGEAIAVLAGDALLNRAFEIMSEHCAKSGNLHHAKAMAKIAKYSGTSGMIGGQVMDILLEGKSPSQDELEYIYTNKTAKLFMAAFGAGGHIAETDDKTINLLENIGRQLGIAFQIKDDLLDYSGGADFGKPTGSDAKNKKATYAAVFGVDKAEEMFARLSAAAINSLQTLPNTEFLLTLAKNLINRTK